MALKIRYLGQQPLGPLEPLRERTFLRLANSGLVDTVEHVSEVSKTIDANEYGSARGR